MRRLQYIFVLPLKNISVFVVIGLGRRSILTLHIALLRDQWKREYTSCFKNVIPIVLGMCLELKK